ncbi:polymer-forming cytoskeletal protein [Pseudodesulfovibrio sp. F-1]|uniref:Polymer-forming cytoskeletal protein n=1 Tax=Pseudodesulfovibrio alkaliphilus TaxID=2661613 RepID=A0A7K1KMK3_9BACT|nr:polymer-forming cytoskeletal protein [Pseudodesulfovibrio alkaliphilus]MUM77305.1 polymer-forming cytoskeletal protein [Pseudodesulfovibrio alkaliphilus]
MGLFSKKKTDNTELNAFLGVGTEYRGKLDFVGAVRIDGRFDGEISTEGDLVLGRKAHITGTVRVGRLTSCGRIDGDVVVTEHTVLEATSVLNGSLHTPVLTVERGAVVEGCVSMSGNAGPVRKKVVAADFGGKGVSGSAGQPDAEPSVSSGSVARTGSDDASI